MGRYNPVKSEYLKKPPSKAAGESEADYKQRLRKWSIDRNRGGSRDQTPGASKSQPAPKKSDDSGSWMDKVVRALK